MKDSLISSLRKALEEKGITYSTIKIEYPEDTAHGDYSTNVAMVYAKQAGMNPRALADELVASLNSRPIKGVASISVAGPGFINITLDDAYVAQLIRDTSAREDSIVPSRKDETHILIEHTDPNAFKAFHIGHLMANAIGESLSRIVGVYGAHVTKICYPSDIGLHIAKSVWAMMQHESDMPSESVSVIERTAFLGRMYAEGTRIYEEDNTVKKEIDELNKKIYEGSDVHALELYEKGKRWSFEHYELLYRRLGTTFDEYIYESEAAPIGKEVVLRELKKGVFHKSEGAVIFKGEEYGLHTRVFLNSAGLTTYEAKDIGLNIEKFRRHPETDESIIVTASEQNDYFKVIQKALACIDQHVGEKTTHIGHGMMRFASGKMSSRTGNVITAESLISELRDLVMVKIQDKDFDDTEKNELADMIAIGAIKYTILRQSVGSDIIFDSATSISFEGDSGPYLQYSAVRAGALLRKAQDTGIIASDLLPEKTTSFEKLLVRYADIVDRAYAERAPQIIANYLTALSGAFNSFYAGHTIVDPKDPLSSYYVTVTKVFAKTMQHGLWLLGIKIPQRM